MERRSVLLGLAALVALRSFEAVALASDSAETSLIRVPMSDGAEITLEQAGSGPSLLLVHGSGSLRRAWAAVTPLLNTQFRTYAMDRRGHGDSTDAKPYSLDREAQDIVEVGTKLPGPVFVLGHSFGGIAVLEALKRTDRFARAVLYEPPIPVPGGIGHESPKAVCDAIASGDNENALKAFFVDYAHLPAPVIAGLQKDPSWPQRVKLAPTLCRETTAVESYHFEPETMAKIAAPTMFLLGSESAAPMATSVRATAAALRNSPVILLNGQQHDAMYTAPVLLADVVRKFYLS
jgi:pimeloyl-ACP methyl ester carboxylesterase